MRSTSSPLSATVVLLAGFGCTPSTEVTLINNASSTVDATVFYHDDQNVLETLIDDVGARLDFTDIEPGGRRTFSRPCEDLQAIQVEADLELVGSLGPSETSEVFRDGTDFGCGDQLTFTFTSSTLPPDLDIGFGNP